ncbi:MAG TPA: tRNA dihydrouridine synthase DusB [Bacilli bacterium]|nr:tRNA dihydrouridine synthase DusB [Bacilli bacterium]
MFKIGNVEIKNSIVLAPLAGYTNQAYRKIIKEFGVGLVYTEMISAKGLVYDNDKTWYLTEIADSEHPIAVQLFGGNAEDLVKAAVMIDQKTKADIIDINMGCPVKKVIKADSGVKMMLDIKKAYDIVSQVVQAVKKPVSIKMRAGWDHQNVNCCEFAKAMEQAGVAMITIHGRTKSDLYGGRVNLDYIKKVKKSVKIPVIGNGDIKSVKDAVRMFEYTNVDGIMVGRGTLGNPWLMRDLVDYFSGKTTDAPPTKKEKIAMIRRHFQELLQIKTEKIVVLEMRTLAAWYVKGFQYAKEFKQKLISIKTKEELNLLIDELEKSINEE